MADQSLNSSEPARPGQTRHIKYVFIDIVKFSANRSVEAQNDIVRDLNEACVDSFETLIPGGDVIYVPTGDGICTAILDIRAQHDTHVRFALDLLRRLTVRNEHLAQTATSGNYMRQFEIRVGITENVDSVVKDINGNRNVAGVGVTLAQRLMSLADAQQILVSDATYQTLNVREQYMEGFQHFRAVVKHGTQLDVYQLRAAHPGLNIEAPEVFRNREPIEDDFDHCLRNDHSTSGQVQCIQTAIRQWRAEIDSRISSLAARIEPNQQLLLEKAQRAWTRYIKTELEFAQEFYAKMRGTMWRVIRADVPHDHLVKRGKDLAAYLQVVEEQQNFTPEGDSAFHDPNRDA
ncbi:MAG TPA: lysozyme inhibitor LprI family protein [Chthoniobacterales bacterium]|nr:lysozyme inhibitor LprI family protein [Chthoniobacterales bacterium]